MSAHVLVCPAHEPLLERLRPLTRPVVLIVEDDGLAPAALEAQRRCELQLHCLEIHAGSLATVALRGEWQQIPIAVHAWTMGPFGEIARRLVLLRKLNLRVFLPAGRAENITALRILASLGVECAALLDGEVDWELLTDLMTYALLGLVPHASIEPFQELATRYDPQRRTDYAAIYFDDPRRYLHLDREGRVALSRADLRGGRFVLQRPEEIDTIDEQPAYRAQLEAWREVFLQPDGCACCPGWRVCLGKFPAAAASAASAGSDAPCRAFFTEVLDVVEQHRAQADKSKQVWRP